MISVLYAQPGLRGVEKYPDSTVTSHTIRPFWISFEKTRNFKMQVKIENTLENNRQALDNMYRTEVIKLLEKINHVTTLGSIAKLGLKPVNVSRIFFGAFSFSR